MTPTRPTATSKCPPASRSSEAIANRLHYLDADRWIPLAAWARFFVSLGLRVAEPDSPARLAVAVSVPTRSFAATLTAVGVVAQRVAVPAAMNPTDHFRALRELPPGTMVSCHLDTTKRMKCRLECFEVKDGIDYVVLQGVKGLRWFIPAAESLKVQASPQQASAASQRLEVRTVRANVELLEMLFRGDQLRSLLRHSRLECLVIGNDGLLRGEMLTPAFASVLDDNVAVGKLHDLLRIRRYMTNDAPFRSDVFPARSARWEETGRLPWVVIFDGGASFLRWYDRCLGNRWVVILDKAESRFEDAVNELNRLQMVSVLGTRGLGSIPAPVGVEYAIFERKAS